MSVEPPQWRWWVDWWWYPDNHVQLQGHVGALTPFPEGERGIPARPIGFRMPPPPSDPAGCPLCGGRHEP